jgi:hypothetical protein
MKFKFIIFLFFIALAISVDVGVPIELKDKPLPLPPPKLKFCDIPLSGDVTAQLKDIKITPVGNLVKGEDTVIIESTGNLNVDGVQDGYMSMTAFYEGMEQIEERWSLKELTVGGPYDIAKHGPLKKGKMTMKFAQEVFSWLPSGRYTIVSKLFFDGKYEPAGCMEYHVTISRPKLKPPTPATL